ncbi:3-ketosteroid 9alpha-monooxygenase subunit A [Litorivivens lipolytica]|uniref:3-ketosteroid 9alpha-monooxygenase subunit A n=1 Tax=Litorivivens lipolytica TaxID=1524264 RepID=A0A7W4Z608_9GAMM|nr:Rieske 2Fe-2S domain-containing protein [Litorivivens lipolytica]MBB3048049.1 3-ketosteroid 9alpha-monooxygenase subunit A [Litorivivens lipolytica]
MAKAEDYGLGPHTFPRGWFIVAEASELPQGRAIPLRFFGKDFALYRGESGRPIMLDAYCPHMQTHLAASDSTAIVQECKQIEGDSIRCPYHGWRFGPDGKCDDIPYFEGTFPRSAVIASYPVEEVMGCIMMWHDPEGGEPQYAPPKLKEWDDPSWVRWELDHLGELEMHPQEILDNMADVHHLGPTHGAPCEYFENEFRDHIYIQRQGGVHAGYNSMLRSSTWYTGPGVLLSKQSFGDVITYELIANTPVDDGVSKVWHAALAQGSSDTPSAEDIEAAKQIQAGALAAFAADFSVWKNKGSATRILQIQTDGPFATGRRWYKQFYDKAENAGTYQEKANGVHHVKNMATPPQEAMDFEGDLFEGIEKR